MIFRPQLREGSILAPQPIESGELFGRMLHNCEATWIANRPVQKLDFSSKTDLSWVLPGEKHSKLVR